MEKISKLGLETIQLEDQVLLVDKEKALSAGCDNFISKPIRKEILGEIIRKQTKYKLMIL